LKELLKDPKNEMVSFDPIPLPLDPSINIVGCFPGMQLLIVFLLSSVDLK
jgi:hypothetical protein